MAAFRNLTTYFNLFDGSLKSTEDLGDTFQKAFLPSLKVTTASGESDLEEWKKAVKAFIDDKCVVSFLKIEVTEDGWEHGDVIFYKFRCNFGSGATMVVANKGYFDKDGRLAKLEAGEPETVGVYAELLEHGEKVSEGK